MGTAPSEEWEVEKYESTGKPCRFNAALGNVVGMFVFGIAVGQTGDRADMLQTCLVGAAPNVGERHFAFPSDCFPWPARRNVASG